MADAAPDIPWLGVVVVELATGKVIRANRAFLAIIGYDEDDVREGRVNVMAITQAAFGEATRDAARQIARSGRMDPIEKTYVRKDGTLRHAWVTGTSVPDEPGLGISYVLDVTERHESEQRARSFAEASFEGLFVHDKGIILDVNAPLTAMFRATAEQMIGQPVFAFADPSCHDLIRRNVANQYELAYEATGLRRDGTTFPMELLGKPLPYGGRTVRVTSVRDLTDQKRAAEALRDAERALRESQKLESLGVLAGGIAHDFNNILAAVLGFAAVARRGVQAGSDAEAALREIENAGMRAAELTRQMLVYSGRGERHVGPMDLNRVAREMSRLLVASFSKKIELTLDLSSELPAVVADAAQVQQVVMNLLTNAAEAIGDARGTIRVSSSRVSLTRGGAPSPSPGEVLAEGDYALLEVTDSGRGMDEATRARIFDPFFTTKATGRGLGLSAMLGILRSHRAGLGIETAPGEGTTFRVYLPLAAQAPATQAKVPFSKHEPRSGVVLVVDDEAALRRSLGHLLRSAGYTVLEASNGAEGIDQYRRHVGDVGLVILDLLMPEVDGRQALREIRAIDPDARVLLTSGFDAEEVLEGVRGEVVGFLPKPYDIEKLLALVERSVKG